MLGFALAINQGHNPGHPSGIRRGATLQIGMGGEDSAGRARFVV